MGVLIRICLILTAVLPAGNELLAQPIFLGGEVKYAGSAGNPSEITVQFLSPNFFATLKLQPNSSQRLSLQRQMYNVIVHEMTGKVIEETLFLVEDQNWVFLFDEKPFSEMVKKTLPQEKSGVRGFFYNTYDTCQSPKKISLFIDEHYAGDFAPGEKSELTVAPGDHTFSVYLDGKRKYVFFKKVYDHNWLSFAGCTDPAALEKDEEKVAFVIYNTTDKCRSGDEIFHLHARLNGKPLAGVAPGKKILVYITKGDYYLEVLKGDTSQRLFKGERRFHKNSIFHHGCSKPEFVK